MKKRKAINLDKLLVLYNILQIILAVYVQHEVSLLFILFQVSNTVVFRIEYLKIQEYKEV